LVEISPNAKPPVCKIMDYGRYKYEETKKKQEAKKKQNIFQLKAGEHDLMVKIGHIKKFIEKKDKVKVTVIFRGREITLSQLGRKVLDQIVEKTDDVAVVELSPKFEGRTLVMVLAPK
jgi:translation initiation factor IF-3